jgi:hypothetical protein
MFALHFTMIINDKFLLSVGQFAYEQVFVPTMGKINAFRLGKKVSAKPPFKNPPLWIRNLHLYLGTYVYMFKPFTHMKLCVRFFVPK